MQINSLEWRKIPYQSTLQDAWTGPSPRRKAEEAPKTAKSVQQTRDCIVRINELYVCEQGGQILDYIHDGTKQR